MLDASLAQQLRTHLEKIVHPIRLIATVDASPKSAELRELLDELASMTEHISTETNGTADRAPSFIIQREASDISVEFAGIPLGHEFTSLVLALLHVGGHPPTASPELREQIKNLEGNYTFETYFSLSCQNCPDVVQALNVMSVLNPNITHTAIDGALFQDEIEERKVLSVPSVYLNGEPFDQGRMTLEQIVAKIDTGMIAREAEKITKKEPFDTLIIGGGPAGAASAIYLARKGIRTGLAADRFGGQVLDTMGIENLISTPYTEGPKLAAALEQNVKEHDVDIMNLQKAKKLTPATNDNPYAEITLESGATLSAQTLIISTGARWRKLNVPGETEYTNKGVAYCPHCDGPLFKGKKVAVIGGGNSGVEAAIDLAGIVEHVTLIEFSTELLADTILQEKLASLPNTTVITNAQTTEILGDDTQVTGLRYVDRETEESQEISLAGVFVQIGLLPNTEWLQDTVKLSDRGEIEIDNRGETSLPGVFAAGDCTTVPYKQIVIALGAGSTAALSAFDHLIRNSLPEKAA